VDVAAGATDEVATEPAEDRATLRCPKCGNDGMRAPLTITETYSAYHPASVRDGRLVLQHALATVCPSVWFDDGAGDYAAHCWACAYSDSLAEFGVPDVEGWQWE